MQTPLRIIARGTHALEYVLGPAVICTHHYIALQGVWGAPLEALRWTPPPHFGTHGGWRLPLDIHSGCKYVVYGVRLWWKQGVPLPGCLI